MRYKFPSRLNKLFTLLTPENKENKYGSVDVSYKESRKLWCFMRTFNGTETIVNGVLTVKKTGVVDCYYNPNITADCRLKDDNGIVWKIISEPENINGNNQFMQFKVECIGAVANVNE